LIQVPVDLSENIRHKIFLMEEVINFPTSLRSHPNYRLGNIPMVPYSDLAGAVCSLAERGRRVAIITGFYIPGGRPPATETDGPPGALTLAEGLRSMGMDVLLVSDRYSLSALRAGLEILGLSEKEIPIVPFPMEDPDEGHSSRRNNEESNSPVSLRFVKDFFKHGPGRGLTHLLYIERAGPSHTLESFTAQERSDRPPLKDFEAILPPSMRNRCFNSRLDDITRFTAKTHFFLEFKARAGLALESIGIGDRGNEIGAGRVPWEVFEKHSSTHREAVFCCRMKTDYLISSGISNWAGYALTAGLALAMGRLDVLRKITPEQEMKVLDHLIRHGPAVDGITFRQEHSVDGIGFKDYMKLIERLKEIALE
jgi:D-glutamate cyclase